MGRAGRSRQVISVAKTSHFIFIVIGVNRPLRDKKKFIEDEFEWMVEDATIITNPESPQ
jgi:ribosome-interacting GTPase 1